MRTRVFLNLTGKRQLVGVLSSEAGEIAFQYAQDFLTTGLELSPISVPLQKSAWRPQSNLFGGLPGFVADSLPDGWGNLLLNRQLLRKGRHLVDIDPLHRLCWVGSQGMGALEYEPEESFLPDFAASEIRLDTLAQNAEDILSDREAGNALDLLSSLNGSSGGARPKIVCLASDDKKTLFRGTEANDGARPWLIKFRSMQDPPQSGALEYAVSLLAKQAGIAMPKTYLFASTKSSGWFGIERFDRTSRGKVHMATAAGLLHCDFRVPCLDYSTLMALTLRLCGSQDLPQMLKRAYFNFVIGNTDDHAKNFSFLMDADGKWRLSPAYDLMSTPGGEHMTSILGVGKNPGRRLFTDLGAKFDMDRQTVRILLEEVDNALAGWPEIARNCGLRKPPEFLPIP